MRIFPDCSSEFVVSNSLTYFTVSRFVVAFVNNFMISFNKRVFVGHTHFIDEFCRFVMKFVAFI